MWASVLSTGVNKVQTMKQKPLPPLNWLRAFEVSARCLNFTHAADELCLTQGAVSQQIRQLESHLGVALFKRLPRGLGLTEEGQAYLPVVQDAITRLAVGTNEIFGQHKRRPIKVRGSLAFFVHWLAPKLRGLSARLTPMWISATSAISGSRNWMAKTIWKFAGATVNGLASCPSG